MYKVFLLEMREKVLVRISRPTTMIVNLQYSISYVEYRTLQHILYSLYSIVYIKTVVY